MVSMLCRLAFCADIKVLWKGCVKWRCKRLAQRYFIGSRGFVVSNVKSVLHNL